MTDRELLADFASTGSQQAFAELVNQHTDMVYATCMRMLGDPEAAEDATQATFMVLWRRGVKLDSDSTLAGWLFRVAELSARDIRKIQTRRVKHEREAVKMGSIETCEPSETEDANWEEVRPLLDSAVAALPAVQRDALVLRYLNGKSRAEIAAETGSHLHAIDKRLTRGLANLRNKLRRRGVAIPLVLLAEFLGERTSMAAPQALSTKVLDVCCGKAAAPAAAYEAANSVLRTFLWAKINAVVLIVLIIAGLCVPVFQVVYLSDAPKVPPAATEAQPSAVTIQDKVESEAPRPMSRNDLKSWSVFGTLPMLVDASHAEIGIEHVRDSAQAPGAKISLGGLIQKQVWDLSKGPVCIRLTVNIPAEPAAAFSICALLPKESVGLAATPAEMEAVLGQHRRLQLLYDGADIIVAPSASLPQGFANRRIVSYRGGEAPNQYGALLPAKLPTLAPGKHTLELLLSQNQVRSRVDGTTLYHGKHGESASYAQFAFFAACNKIDNENRTIVHVENVVTGTHNFSDGDTDF